jgi:hypothetical protein
VRVILDVSKLLSSGSFFLLGLFLDIEDRDSTFLLNVGKPLRY